jgi:galactose oxidase
MRSIRMFSRLALASYALLALALCAERAGAQVTEVVVGITPTCPYGLVACWAGAYDAVMRMDCVESVDKTPNAYNCTASVQLKDDSLPDPDKWAEQFKKTVDQAYGFRGVEVSISGTVEARDGVLALRVPGIDRPIELEPLRHKLQWNAAKASPRQPEPDEREAHQQLAIRAKESKVSPLKVHVTGPLTKSRDGYVLEVREVIVQKTVGPSTAGAQR